MEFKLQTRVIVLLFWDIFSTYIAYILGAVLTGQAGDILISTDVLFDIGLLAIFNCVIFAVFRLYNDLWEYASSQELLKIVSVSALSTFVGATVLFLVDIRFPIRVYFVAWLVLLIFVGAGRFAFRFFGGRRSTTAPSMAKVPRKRTLVVGAGETASLTIKRLAVGDYYMSGKPIVAVDDDPAKKGMRIHGVKVMGNRDDISELVKRYSIEQIVIAIPSAGKKDLDAIYDICIGTDCHLLTLPNVRDIPIDQLDNVKLRDVSVEDLLSRDEVVLDTRHVSGYIAGKTILVTGGGGSIGSELVRQLCLVAPRRIVVFDIYENTAYELQKEIQSKYDDVELVVEVGSVRDYPRLVSVFSKYTPQVVFHAAAHKHVPLMENCPQEAIRNNVFGTMNVANAARLHGVERFIFISTDKAVNPTSVMGTTKKIGEMVIQSMAQNSDTIFAAVRFGNVLGSHGSVIPLFQRQIAEGGPVTVTHPDITRYFMTIPEASRLVVQAGGIAKGGEIFILDMGEPVRILDLARKLIRLSGYTPGKDIQIEFTGLRPGEKLYEELWTDKEKMQATSERGIMRSTDDPVSKREVQEILSKLAEVIEQSSRDIKLALAEIVPSYKPYITDGDVDDADFSD